MIKFRLTDSKRWRIIEVELEHNHLISPINGKFYKSHKHLGLGTKRALELDSTEEVQKIRLFRTVIVDVEANGSVDVDEGQSKSRAVWSNQLKPNKGDAEAIQNFFSHLQLTDTHFFYVMDINEMGCLRNLFWANERSRVAYNYFGDVVAIDTTCLSSEYEVPLVLFLGVNHHKQSIMFGCGLIAGETIESYTWLFRAWITCILGRPPQVIITDQCSILQTVVADVFPRASHCLCLSSIMQKIPEKPGGLLEYDAVKAAISRGVYYSLRTNEFDAAWEDMMQQYEIRGHEWLQALYDDRKRRVPAYVKETFLAGMFPTQPSDAAPWFFDCYLSKQTPLIEFLEKYDQVLQTKWQQEALADLDSKNSSVMHKPRCCYFELQVSKLYTKKLFGMFEREIKGMYSCLSSRQINVDGPGISYLIKEQVEVEGNHNQSVTRVMGCITMGLKWKSFASVVCSTSKESCVGMHYLS